MNENIAIIMHVFLDLPNLDKLKVVEAINEYFDSNDREPIRARWDEAFEAINRESHACICCDK
ncbi:MAG TPA: hypothetical protein PLR83_03190 [Pyrinomonadaceae bacterium]|nr:hypothetical protein [Pyrinomonadaceae bacterium]